MSEQLVTGRVNHLIISPPVVSCSQLVKLMVGEKIADRGKAILTNTRDNAKTLADDGVADLLLESSRRMKKANKDLVRGGR